ncbi:MAG TPA: aldo/keto reductase [Blastocatellia bacterium]|nr:aldo/keto reductase [Blastocatellia bacterium]
MSKATAEGTRRYAQRMSSAVAKGHFHERNGLLVSSIGLGTYLGQWDEHTDRNYQEAIKRATELGCNVLDSAINYRFQRSERAIGAALRETFEAGQLSRDEIIVATKAGFFPFDGEPPRDPRAWVTENVIDKGLARPEEIVGGSHCMTPAYLEDQLTRSLGNLGLETIDIYYVHNPETQLEAVPRDEFLRRVRAAFEFLERAAKDGRIGHYGTATWNGYRQEAGSRGYLSLAEMDSIAREVGGDEHHFRVVQLPYNLAMPEALTNANQRVRGEDLSFMMAADRLGVTVMCSASMMQARLSQNLPPFVGQALKGLSTDAQRAIQFVRSTPGVTTALVGMSRRSHVDENLAAAGVPPAPVEEFFSMFSNGEA